MQDIKILEGQLAVKGYLDIAIDPSLDLFDEIKKLKKEKNAVVLAHYYQEIVFSYHKKQRVQVLT
jgi:quinolinate synthase